MTSVGSLTRPSFRSAQHPSSGKSGFLHGSIEFSTRKPEGIQNDDSFLINGTVALYSSPITGFSGPFAVTHFLQQADDEMSQKTTPLLSGLRL